MKIWGSVLGGYPRSRVARKALRDSERGRAPYSAVEEVIYRASIAVIGAQASAGLDYIVDGMIDWHDIFRPFAEAWRNVTPTGLLRYFDNNFFYRIPHFIDEPEPTRLVLAPRVSAFINYAEPSRLKVVVPGPVTFSRMSHNSSGLRPEELAERIATLLAAEARAAAEAGASMVQVDEPFLSDPDATRDDAVLASELVSRIASEAGVPTVLAVYFGVPEPVVYEAMLDSRVEYLSLDVVDSPSRLLSLVSSKGWGGHKPVLGLVDSRRLIDDFNLYTGLFHKVPKDGSDEVGVTTSTWLDLIPYDHSLKKTKRLGTLVERLRGETQ